MKGRKLSTALLGALVGVILASSQGVFATHTPADKVVAAGDNMTQFSAGQDVPILTATLRTSKPTDLMLHVTLECTIFTELLTGDLGQQTDTAEASANIDIWVEIDGQVVPINSISSPPQNPPPPGDKDLDGVTFCNRVYGRTVTDREGDDSQDEIRDYIRTKSAHAFNWLRLNMGAGIHTIIVKADIDTSTTDPRQTATAIIGTRTLIAEPSKLANDATI